jgi:hypothetical protein
MQFVQNVVCGPDVNVGNGCLSRTMSPSTKVSTLKTTFLRPVHGFTNVFNPGAYPQDNELWPTQVKRGATSANATTCAVSIGSICIHRAGAIRLPARAGPALMVCNPANHIGWMCECGRRQDEQLSALIAARHTIRNQGAAPYLLNKTKQTQAYLSKGRSAGIVFSDKSLSA